MNDALAAIIYGLAAFLVIVGAALPVLAGRPPSDPMVRRNWRGKVTWRGVYVGGEPVSVGPDPEGTALDLATYAYLGGRLDVIEFEALAAAILAGEWDKVAAVLHWRPTTIPTRRVRE
jgi:hypothetical protein